MKINIDTNYKHLTRLALAFLIFPLALVMYAERAPAKGLVSISPMQANELIQKENNNENFVIIDIRTPREFKAGHVQGAILIDYYSKNFLNNMKALDKSKTYLMYCRSANRSTKAMGKIKNMGFTSLYNMRKGLKGWVKAGFPVYKDKKKLI